MYICGNDVFDFICEWFSISSIFGSWSTYKMFLSLFCILLTLSDKNIFCSQSRALFLHKDMCYFLSSLLIFYSGQGNSHYLLNVCCECLRAETESHCPPFSLCAAGTWECNEEEVTFIEHLLLRLKPCIQCTYYLVGRDGQEHRQPK